MTTTKPSKDRLITNIKDKLDIYATDVKSFNFEGRYSVSSKLGYICTIFTIIIILAYAATKIISDLIGTNPVIFQFQNSIEN